MAKQNEQRLSMKGLKLKGKKFELGKKTKVLGIVRIFVVILVFEVFYMARKKMREHINLTSVAVLDIARAYVDMAIDRQGDVYILSADLGVVKKEKGKEPQTWAFDTPKSAIAVTKNSILVTSGTGSFRRIDKKTGKQEEVVVEGFTELRGMATDDKDRIYMSDTNKNRIVVLKEDGEIKNIFGDESGKEMLLRPCHIACDNKYIYVMNAGMRRINKYTLNGKFKRSWAYLWEKDSVENIAVDFNGHLYVNDHLHSRVWIFSTDGKMIGTCNKDARGVFEFIAPGGIADDKNGYIYVASHWIGKFEPFD